METLKGLPGQIMLTVENLKTALEQAARAETVDATREHLATAIKLVDVINRLANEAQGAVDAQQEA